MRQVFKIKSKKIMSKYTIVATSKYGDKFRFDDWGDGEWVKSPHEEKTFETREAAQDFIDRHPFYDASLFEGWASIEVVEIEDEEDECE